MAFFITILSVIGGILVTLSFSTLKGFEVGNIYLEIDRLRDYLPIILMSSLLILWTAVMTALLLTCMTECYKSRRKHMTMYQNFKRNFDFYSVNITLIGLIYLPYLLIFN